MRSLLSTLKTAMLVLVVAAFGAFQSGNLYAQDGPHSAANEDAIQQLSVIVEAWLASPHADITSDAFHHWDEDGEIAGTCATCHSQFGLLEYLRGDMATAGRFEGGVPIGGTVGCAACHSPSAVALTSVPFPSGVSVDTFGSSATCAVCHQGRTAGSTVEAAVTDLGEDDVSADLGFINVHYAASAATIMGSVTGGGFEYPGRDYRGQFTHVPDFSSCTSCHMPHSLQPVAIENCTTCHQGADSFEAIRTTRIDVDGDGDISEGIADPIATLHAQLLVAIQSYAGEIADASIIYADASFPYFFADTNSNGMVDDGEAIFPNRYVSWTPRLLKAAYNYQFVAKDTGAFAHNPHYVLQLLYDSLEDLATQVDVDIAALNRP